MCPVIRDTIVSPVYSKCSSQAAHLIIGIVCSWLHSSLYYHPSVASNQRCQPTRDWHRGQTRRTGSKRVAHPAQIYNIFHHYVKERVDIILPVAGKVLTPKGTTVGVREEGPVWSYPLTFCSIFDFLCISTTNISETIRLITLQHRKYVVSLVN